MLGVLSRNSHPYIYPYVFFHLNPGLRGPMGCGYNKMNELTVIQAAQGLILYLEEVVGVATAQSQGIVVGYDHRAAGTLNSKTFAELTCAVAIHRGFKVYLFEGLVATPLVPFAINAKGACAGVMVTASHNPKQDNGYKVYWGNGSQIIPPHDGGIADCILRSLKPWSKYDTTQVCKSPLYENPREAIVAAYMEKAKSLCRYPDDNASSSLGVVYTAMHGVGLPFVEKSFAAFQHKPFFPVKEQVQADPTFPTVEYPNPEEGKGALTLSFATAEANGATLVLANDPDADRLAVSEKQADGSWHMFTGNQIGILLGHWQWVNWRRSNPTGDASKVAMLCSTVSSKMLRALARKEGFLFEETLTGFKWLGNRAAELRSAGYEVIFSFEEAIGFCVGDVVNDKDGVVAAAVFAEMAKQLWKSKTTVLDHLHFLYESYGHFLTLNSYCLCYSPDVTNKIFSRIRNDGHYWHTVGGYKIESIRDLMTPGYDSNYADNKPRLPTDSSAHMVTLSFANGCVATLRTSGTEPKIKYYVELHGPVPAEVQRTLEHMVHGIVQEMLEPEKNGLIRPKTS